MHILNWIGRILVNVTIALLVYGFLLFVHMWNGPAGFISGVVFTVSVLARRSIQEVDDDTDDITVDVE